MTRTPNHGQVGVTVPSSRLPSAICPFMPSDPDSCFSDASLLKPLRLQLHSSLTSNYVSGTHSIVFVNCPNEQIARDIARAILDKKMAASVNILPKASSLYFWKGEIEEATEILLLIKTKTSKIPRLSSYIRLVHPFEVPEVFSLPVDQGDAHYLKWLEEGMKEN